MRGEIYHLIKPDDQSHGNGNTPKNRMSIVEDHKVNSVTNGESFIFIFVYLCLYLDLYLARLITSKQIIQPYVDQFFNSILLNQPGAQIPPPIKYLFDFLDQDAIQSLNNQLHNQHNTTLNNVSF